MVWITAPNQIYAQRKHDADGGMNVLAPRKSYQLIDLAVIHFDCDFGQCVSECWIQKHTITRQLSLTCTHIVYTMRTMSILGAIVSRSSATINGNRHNKDRLPTKQFDSSNVESETNQYNNNDGII